jgi:hypothetical protein
VKNKLDKQSIDNSLASDPKIKKNNIMEIPIVKPYNYLE